MNHNIRVKPLTKTLSSVHQYLKGKKGRSMETNLRKAPYLLEDGDLIGYIVAENDQQTVTEESFCTDIERNLKQMSIDKIREQ